MSHTANTQMNTIDVIHSVFDRCTVLATTAVLLDCLE